jgi:protein phosphatase-4 regulatory subunit 3
LLRRIIGLKDDVYIRHIHDKGILDAVVHCFVANGTRYNLLNSSLIELFEYIRAVWNLTGNNYKSLTFLRKKFAN